MTSISSFNSWLIPVSIIGIIVLFFWICSKIIGLDNHNSVGGIPD